METYKKAASDFRKTMHIDECIFQECRMIARAYRKADVTSNEVEGKSNEYDKRENML